MKSWEPIDGPKLKSVPKYIEYIYIFLKLIFN